MTSANVRTHQVTLWMAGDVSEARRVVRDFCYSRGACFTITPTQFIYTGGEEEGFVVGLVNYPKFPSKPNALHARAEELARKLLPALNQRTCLLVGTDESVWITVDPPGVRK